MKKLFLSIALFALVTTLTTAQAVNRMNVNSISISMQDDDGFVTIKLEDLNENVQKAVLALTQNYELDSLKYNSQKQVTKVEATSKEGQATKVVYFDNEGKEILLDEDKSGGDVESFVSGEMPSAEVSYIVSSDDDGFITVKFDDLNESVQRAVAALAQNHELNALRYNAEKQITKVQATSKADRTVKVFYLDNEGEEVKQPVAGEQESDNLEMSVF